MAMLAAAAFNTASAAPWDDESVVFDGLHYTIDSVNNTATCTYAILPRIRTGVCKRAPYTHDYYYSEPYYEKSENYEHLGALVVPDSVDKFEVDKIGFYAFHNSGITSVTIGKNVKTLDEGAFICNDQLASIKWGAALTNINPMAFYGCKALTKVSLPDAVKKAEFACFGGCDNLTEFSTGNGLESVSSGMFELCGNLSTLNIGNSVRDIDPSAFWGCEALHDINIAPSNKHFTFTDGLLINNDSKSLIFFTTGKDTCSIPDGIEKVENGALCFNDDIRSLTIPASVTYFGYNSVAENDNLTAIHCKAATPAKIEEKVNVFHNVTDHCTLYVPAGAVESYRAAPVWKDFKEIKEEVASGITDIAVSGIGTNTDRNVYAPDGRIVRQNATSLEGLGKGIYIYQGQKHIVK